MKKRTCHLLLGLVLLVSLIAPTTTSQARNLKDPFAVLLMGVDTGKGREDKGRSDVMILATVNLEANRIDLFSIPRDSYVAIPGRGQDKINHAYAFGGPDLARETVADWLGIKVPYHAYVDMDGLQAIVQAVGGIDVTSTTSFEMSGYQFEAGQSYHMDGDMAVAYARDRSGSGGDYDRQDRQRQMILAIYQAISQHLTGVKEAMDMAFTLRKSVNTNLSLVEMGRLAMAYPKTNPQINFHQFEGEGMMKDDIYYEQIAEESLASNLALIKDQLKGQD